MSALDKTLEQVELIVDAMKKLKFDTNLFLLTGAGSESVRLSLKDSLQQIISIDEDIQKLATALNTIKQKNKDINQSFITVISLDMARIQLFIGILNKIINTSNEQAFKP